MKTAEEWTKENGYETLDECGSDERLRAVVQDEINHRRAIQLDAAKAGMRLAAKKARHCEPKYYDACGHLIAAQAIFTTAENLTLEQLKDI